MRDLGTLAKKLKRRVYGYEREMFSYLDRLSFVPSEGKPRYNLLIPNIDKAKMYGGQRTALNFFLELAGKKHSSMRLIVDEPVNEEVMEQYPDWKLVGFGEDDDSERLVISIQKGSAADRVLAVRSKDVFVTTTWQSHYIVADVLGFQKEQFGVTNPIIYLLQDFEAGFNKWSTEYLLAESTYHTPGTLAVFNSSQLADFFHRLGYQFDRSWIFEPRLTKELYEKRKQLGNVERKNRILFYGRPYNARNAFSLIIEGINLFLERYPDLGKDWEFVSIGSPIKKLALSDGRQLESLGKMSLEEYAHVLAGSKAGISLMCSPHPSYPPLEMAAFGLKTITNAFVSKDLSAFSKNIISLEKVTFDTLCEAIRQAITESGVRADGERDADENFFQLEDQFTQIVSEIADVVEP